VCVCVCVCVSERERKNALHLQEWRDFAKLDDHL
jgi:hypothetical protein